MKHRRYCFSSEWDIDQPPATVWRTLTKTPFTWPKWWPQLTNLRSIKPTPDLRGTSFSCTWKAPIGYGLGCDIRFEEVNYLKRVVLSAAGDLNGTVTCVITPIDRRTHVDIEWRVATTLSWMNYLHPVLKPFFVWSHHAVMRSGERGLQQYLRQQSA